MAIDQLAIPAAVKLFGVGLLYGFSLAIPPGPMNALIASRSLISFRSGFLVGAGAMTADFILMILTLALYSVLRDLPLYPLYIAGSAMMIYIVYWIVKFDPEQSSREREVRESGNFLLGLGLGLTNPFQIGWWLLVGLSFISIFGVEAVLGLFTAIFIWINIFPLSIRRGYSLNSRATVLAIKIFSVATLTAFIAVYIYESVRGIIQLLGG